MKRKMKKLLFSLALMGTLMLQCMSPVYAYDWATDEYTDEGYFLVDNWKDRGTHVTLYLYTEIADRNIAYNKNFYTMRCVEGELPESEVPGRKPFANIMFEFRPENKTVVQEIGDGEIWSYEFSIENGTYEWSQYDGNSGYIHTYDSNFNLTFLDESIDPRYGCETEKIEVNGENVRIYAVYGHKEFAQNADEYREWVIANEEKEREDKQTMDSALADEIIKVEPENTPEPVIESTLEPTNEPEGTVVYVEDVLEEKEEPNTIIPVIIAGLILVVIFVAYKLKK